MFNATFIAVAPYIRPEHLEIHIVPWNTTLYLPWALEPVVHWVFSGLNWLMGY